MLMIKNYMYEAGFWWKPSHNHAECQSDTEWSQFGEHKSQYDTFKLFF